MSNPSSIGFSNAVTLSEAEGSIIGLIRKKAFLLGIMILEEELVTEIALQKSSRLFRPKATIPGPMMTPRAFTGTSAVKV